MVLSSWPKPLREFTRFIWCMQTECRSGRQSPYQANRLGLWVWHVLLKCWIQTRRTRACRRIRRRKTTTTRMECWRPIWTRTSWFSRTMLSMSATSFYEFTIQQTKCRPVLTERSGSVCQLLCALGLHYPHRYHTIVIDPTIRQLGFDLPRHTWSLMNLMRSNGSLSITFVWLWPATDHEPHCRYVPANKIWRLTESTPRSGWWRSHMVGIYSDCSTREIIITHPSHTSRSQLELGLRWPR